MLRNNEKDLPIELTNAIFALEPNKSTLKREKETLIFEARDHIDPDMLASKFEQDLYNFDPKAKLMAPSTRKLQMQRSKVLQIAGLQCMRERGIKAMPPNLIPSMDQTITMLLNHPGNYPYNKPTGRFSNSITFQYILNEVEI